MRAVAEQSVDQYECLHDFDVNLFPGLPASGIDLFYFLLCFALSGACKNWQKVIFDESGKTKLTTPTMEMKPQKTAASADLTSRPPAAAK